MCDAWWPSGHPKRTEEHSEKSGIFNKVVKPNDEIQADFAGMMPDELNEDAYILVANDSY